jgi:flagellar protein FlaG
MINGIFETKGNSQNVPAAEIRNRNQLNADNKIKAEEKVVNSEDQKKQELIDTEQAMERVISAAKFFNRKIHLEVEKDLNMMIVKVIDGETDEVIRQIPAEELVELSNNADDLKGLLINKEG